MQRGGKIIERELFGALDPELLQAQTEKKGEQRRTGEHITFRTAMEIVRRSQGDNDPNEPDAQFAYDLHAAIAAELTPEDYARLRFYTAIGASLDTSYGVDAFFDYQPEDGPRITVTVDVTTDLEKARWRCQADVVLLVPTIGLDKETHGAVKYGNALNFYRDKIVAAIRERLPKRREAYAR